MSEEEIKKKNDDILSKYNILLLEYHSRCMLVYKHAIQANPENPTLIGQHEITTIHKQRKKLREFEKFLDKKFNPGEGGI